MILQISLILLRYGMGCGRIGPYKFSVRWLQLLPQQNTTDIKKNNCGARPTPMKAQRKADKCNDDRNQRTCATIWSERVLVIYYDFANFINIEIRYGLRPLYEPQRAKPFYQLPTPTFHVSSLLWRTSMWAISYGLTLFVKSMSAMARWSFLQKSYRPDLLVSQRGSWRMFAMSSHILVQWIEGSCTWRCLLQRTLAWRAISIPRTSWVLPWPRFCFWISLRARSLN